MGEIISISNGNQKNTPERCETELIEVAEGILLDTRADLSDKQTISMPIAQFATLGAGVAALLPAFRTVTQTTNVNISGLYRLANEGVGDALKVAKNGNFWGAFKTADGKSKFAQLQAAGPVSSETMTVMPIDPATIMIAIALFSIEQKLDSIAETGRFFRFWK